VTMKRIFSAGRGLAFIVFMTVFLFTGCGQSAEPKSEVKNPTLHDAAVKMVADMSLEEKIGQMLLIGIDGTEIDEGALSMLRDYHVGGVILFDRNMNNKYQVTGLNANLQRLNKEYNKLPLYLCVDQEGGMVARMKQGLTVAPAAARIAEQGTPEDARRWAYQTAMELETIGFNVNFAPVLDIGIPYGRSYGHDAASVSKFTEAACRGYDQAGIIYSLKHFPGMGKSEVDPHTEQYRITASKEILLQEDTIPFKNIIQNFDNQDFMVMVGHLIYTGLDTLPASVSPQVINNFLRNELGFQGIVITDDMEMGALTSMYGFREMGVAAVQAGVDVLLVCHNYEHQQQVYQGVLEAVKTNKLTTAAIDAAAVRIVENKMIKLLDAGKQQELLKDLQKEAQ
uniref:beta-N-acetylhexosaminidase n=2 Tax=Phascolarctobacterium faecium TaxID=33025 RepID=UPI003A8E97F2